MIGAVVSDLDGTLLDSLPAWNALPARLLAHFGVPAPAGLAADLAELSMTEAVAHLKARFGLPGPVEALSALCARLMDRAYRREIPLLPGAAAGIAYLRGLGLPVAIATAGDAALARAALERLGLWGEVAFVITEAQVGRSKRHPEIYLRAAKRLGVAPGDCLVLEDAPHAIATARAAGFVVCAVGAGAADLSAPPDAGASTGATDPPGAANLPGATDSPPALPGARLSAPPGARLSAPPGARLSVPPGAARPAPLLRVDNLSELEAIFSHGECAVHRRH
ncbi:MAG: HAD-IA family hydrolase [Christensenellales bacterium]